MRDAKMAVVVVVVLLTGAFLSGCATTEPERLPDKTRVR